MIAAARNRSTRSSSRSDDRTNRSWAKVRGWKLSATSTGTGSAAAPVVARSEPAPGGAARAPLPGRTRRGPRAPVVNHASASPAQRSRSDVSRIRASASEAGSTFGGRQQVGERVEVVADPDPALGAGLERRRAAAAERVEDDVAGSRVAGDERMGEGGREARQVRAHRVEPVAPQALLILPLGGDRAARAARSARDRAGRGRAGRAGRSGRPDGARLGGAGRDGRRGRRWSERARSIPILWSRCRSRSNDGSRSIARAGRPIQGGPSAQSQGPIWTCLRAPGGVRLRSSPRLCAEPRDPRRPGGRRRHPP